MLIGRYRLGVMLHKVTRAYGDQRSKSLWIVLNNPSNHLRVILPGSSKNYDVSFLESAQNPARLCYTLHLLALTGDDKHQLLLGSGHHYVPLPEIRRNNPRFSLPVGEHIRLAFVFCCYTNASSTSPAICKFSKKIDVY